jgi:peptidoglycan/LPS O-acetylase OafA/YrhL
MYLVHPLLLAAVSGVPNPLVRFTWTFTSAVLVASLSYRYLETPLLRLKDRFRPSTRRLACAQRAQVAPRSGVAVEQGTAQL